MASRSICPVCLDLKGDPDHRVNVKAVALSRDGGCPGCNIVSWILEPYMEQLVGKSAEVRLRLRQDRYLCYGGTLSPRELIAELEVKGIPRNPDATRLSEMQRQVACPWAELPVGPMVSGDTGSSEAVSRVASWLSNCKNQHEDCDSTSTRLPTRVLQLDGPNKIKLYHSNGENALYACLSHCWGRGTMIQTTTSNLQKHLTDIPWDELPPNFQDAVTFSYQLGLKYLWIDSLCIIQDSIDDWQQEGSKMSAIYENSYITLAASTSPGAYYGCFVRSDHVSRIKTFWNSANQPYEVHCRVPLPRVDGIPEPPLQQRGWVFQERLLSKRIVHFMYDELYWECMRGSTCECAHEVHSPGSMFGFKHNLYAELRDCEDINLIEERWQTIVEEYTKRRLTFPSDIFPALQGLAKLVSPRMGNYLAGHWEASLARSLCWYVQREDFENVNSTEWRAPTWSWASALCPVHWPSWMRSQRPFTFFTVIGSSTVPKGADPTGQLSYGEVILKGKCLSGEVAVTKTLDPWTALPKNVKGDFATKPKYSSAKLHLFEDETRSLGDGDQEPWSCYPHWDYNFKCERSMRVLAMRMHAVSAHYSGAGNKQECWLVLKVKDSKKGVYERLGLIEIGHALPIPLCDPRERLEALYDSAAKEIEITAI